MGEQGRRSFAGDGRARAAIPERILPRMRRGAQPSAARSPRLQPAPHEFGFLVGSLIDAETLEWAKAEALACGVATHEVLLASGIVSQEDYAAALAHWLGVPAVRWDAQLDLTGVQRGRVDDTGLPGWHDGRPCRVLAASDATPDAMLGLLAGLRARGAEAALAPRRFIDAAIEAHLQGARLDWAVRGLLKERPASSAGAPGATWQALAGACVVGLAVGGFAVVPDAAFAALAALIALPFLCVTLLRVVALWRALAGPATKGQPSSPQRAADRSLPVYTILVPLFDEAGMLPGLVQSLRELDYPPAKLEIFLVLEAADTATQAAVLELVLPGNFRTLVVPDQQPRTKPKALNYALQFARGAFVVVFDAEDRPEPDQLRRAWDVFRHAPAELGCLQARLNIDNARQSWLTRQFTIEYSALFDAMLPALERLRLPVPLGGTSNHFARATLARVGGWDPFNVTEDADLGIRLARHGFHTGVLASTTWEEAPPVFGSWIRQRTRWLKGWMQTYLVHTRSLRRLNRDLGLRAAIGFHVLMGGLIVSALVHPWSYALLAWNWLAGDLMAPAETLAGAVMWTIVWINLGVGYAVSILVGALSVWRRGQPGLAMHALMMPLYWLLISAAAYRAVWQFARDPYRWEKTEHNPRPP